jgi:uncharacterized protein
MVKPRGSICNLACQYCYYLKKEQLYPAADFRMSDTLLEEYTRQYLAAQPSPEVTFAWQGGEPTLMGLDFYRKAVEFQAHYRQAGITIHNTFQTNGVMLDEAWCDFFHDNNFLIGLSIDGPRPLHDVYRQDKGGRPTFDLVLQALRLLQKKQVRFNTLTCVSAANAGQALKVYRFLCDEAGSEFIQFIPIVERDNENGFQAGSRVTNRSVDGRQYADFLIAIFDEWVRNDVGRIFVQIFDAALSAWVGRPPGLCIFEETCGQTMAMEFNGDLYACDHYVEPGYYLGNITTKSLDRLARAPRQAQFGMDKRRGLPAYCQACEVRFICNGGCPKDRLLKTPDRRDGEGEPGLNYLCAGYRAFFNYAGPFMRRMAAALKKGQAPASIMPWVASQPRLDEAPPGSPCPCGSGKPVEDCHRAPQGYIPPNLAAPPPIALPDRRRRH